MQPAGVQIGFQLEAAGDPYLGTLSFMYVWLLNHIKLPQKHPEAAIGFPHQHGLDVEIVDLKKVVEFRLSHKDVVDVFSFSFWWTS